MDKIISGRIYKTDLKNRIIYIKHRKKLQAYYLQRSLIKTFGKYLKEGVFVTFNANQEKKLIRNRSVMVMNYFIKITINSNVNQKVFYDIQIIRKGIRDLVNKVESRLYVDIEMTMQNFNQKGRFVQEVIQVGYVLEDENNNIIEKQSVYIKPVKFPKLNRRTKSFLNVTQEKIDRGIKSSLFIEKLERIIKKYNPTFVVWGANDYLGLDVMYKISKAKTRLDKSKFLDLLRLHKNYFNLKNDLGLFKALEMYNIETSKQKHDALDDAKANYKIFKEFKKIIND